MLAQYLGSQMRQELAAGGYTHLTSLELEVEETGRFAVETDLQIACDRRNLAVRGFAHHFPTRMPFQKSPQPLPDDGMVIHQQDANRHDRWQPFEEGREVTPCM